MHDIEKKPQKAAMKEAMEAAARGVLGCWSGRKRSSSSFHGRMLELQHE